MSVYHQLDTVISQKEQGNYYPRSIESTTKQLLWALDNKHLTEKEADALAYRLIKLIERTKQNATE